jgi:chromosome segregation ATPase
MEAIKKKLTTLRIEVDEATAREAEAKEEAVKARQDAERLQEEKEDLQRKLVILQDDLEKSESRAEDFHKDAEEKASTLDETERLLRKLTTNKDADSDEKEILIEEIRGKTDRCVELEKLVEELNGRIKLLEGDLEAAEDRNDEQSRKVGSLEKELTEATNSLKERVVSDERSKKAEDDLEDKVRDLKSKSSEQETQLEEYKRRVTQLEREKDQLEGVYICEP